MGTLKDRIPATPTSASPEASDPPSQKPDQKKKKTKRKDSRKAPSPSDQPTTPDEQEKESDWRNPELAEESESALPLFSVPTTKVAPSEESAKRLARSQPKTEAGVNGSNKKNKTYPRK